MIINEKNLNHLQDEGNQQGNIDINSTQQLNNTNLPDFNPNYVFFLGGFVEGEGSNSVSISVSKTFKYGINIQPVFNVSQHENGLRLLESFKTYFGVGSVVKKNLVHLMFGFILLKVINILSNMLCLS